MENKKFDKIEKEISQIKDKIYILNKKDSQTFLLPFLKIKKKTKRTIITEAKLPNLKLSLNENEEVVKRLCFYKNNYRKETKDDDEIRFSTYERDNLQTECTDEVYRTIQYKTGKRNEYLLNENSKTNIYEKNNIISKLKKSRNMIYTIDVNKRTIETDSDENYDNNRIKTIPKTIIHETALKTIKTTKNNESLIKNKSKKEDIEAEIENSKKNLNFLKEKYMNLSRNYVNVNIKLNELKYEKEAFLNILEKYIRKYEEYVEEADNNGNLNKRKNSNHKEKDEIKEEDYLKRTNLKKKVNKLNDDIDVIKKEILISNFIKDSLTNDIHKVEFEVKEKEKEIYEKVDLLTKYYHLILEEGVEVMKTGLTWIILSIWKINSEVLLSKLPKHLDISIVKYLFLRAHKEIELMKTERLLLEIKDIVRVFRGREYRQQKRKLKLVFKKEDVESSLFKFRTRIGVMKIKKKEENKSNFIGKSVFLKKEDENLLKHGYHAMKKYFHSKFDFRDDEKEENYEYSQIVRYVEELEVFSRRLNDDLEEMKRNEIRRIVNEYLFNNYERKYKVKIEKVFSSIVGENISEEMKYFFEERKRFVRNFEACRCYKK